MKMMVEISDVDYVVIERAIDILGITEKQAVTLFIELGLATLLAFDNKEDTALYHNGIRKDAVAEVRSMINETNIERLSNSLKLMLQ